MRGIVPDINVEGHVERLLDVMHATDWHLFWEALELDVESLPEIGLDRTSPDDEVWRTCQQERLVLITANRNHDGSNSLEAVIQSEGTATSLPVLTIGDPDRIFQSGVYALRTVERLLDILDGIDLYRGAGRLYIP